MARGDPVSIRLHPKVLAALENTAKDLEASKSWVIEAALVEYMRDSLPPGFAPGMPHKEHKK